MTPLIKVEASDLCGKKNDSQIGNFSRVEMFLRKPERAASHPSKNGLQSGPARPIARRLGKET